MSLSLSFVYSLDEAQHSEVGSQKDSKAQSIRTLLY